jgi:hypothetical protein
MPHSASAQWRQRNLAARIEPAHGLHAVEALETSVTFKTALLALLAAAAVIGAAIVAVPNTAQKTSDAAYFGIRIR